MIFFESEYNFKREFFYNANVGGFPLMGLSDSLEFL